MSTNKSVSPAEFRLHNKVFNIDFAPSNYFERVRFEIIFQQLVLWFWRQYGIYFYIHKLKVMDEKALLQIYFYKTYLYQQRVNHSVEYSTTKSTEGFIENTGDKRYKTAFSWFYMYSPELFTLFRQLTDKSSKPIKGQRWGLKNKLIPTRAAPTVKKAPFIKKGRFARSYLKTAPKFVTKRPQHSINLCTHLVTYFFLHFFRMQVNVLAKSLYKAVTSNALFKHEHQVLLYRTRFLKWYRWSFDFLFLANYALTFSNMNFLFPFYLTHIVKKYKQFPYAELFFNILRKLYFYKRNVRAIKVLINGPYNRHGRTHFRVLKIGDLALSQSQSCVMYDVIQWVTPYGAVSLKLWVYYADYLISK